MNSQTFMLQGKVWYGGAMRGLVRRGQGEARRGMVYMFDEVIV